MTKLTDFWGIRFGIKSVGAFTIILLLFILTIIAGFVLGYGFKRKKSMDWTLVVLYAVFTSLVIYFVLDIDRPSRGPINLEAVNQFIFILRDIAAAY